MAHCEVTFASETENNDLKSYAMKNMNYDIDSLGGLISSEISFHSLVDMIRDMDLELLDVSVA